MVLRKLLVLVLVLLVSLMVAVSAFAQTAMDQEGSSGDLSATEESSSDSSQEEEESSDDSSTDPSQEEESSSIPPTDWNSILGAAQLSDVCPAVLDAAVVEQFRAAAPTLVQACESASQEGTVPAAQDSVVSPEEEDTTLPPSDPNTTEPTAEEQGSTAPVA